MPEIGWCDHCGTETPGVPCEDCGELICADCGHCDLCDKDPDDDAQ